jgi:hypothetical protein
MQKRIDVPSRGFAVIFNKNALQFVLHWRKPMRVSKNWIHGIEIAAASPNNYFCKNEFAGLYSTEPDLAAALLNHMRQKWSRLETSKAGKLKKFLSQNTCAKWHESFAPRDAVEEADGLRKIISQKAPKPFVGARAFTEDDRKFFAWSNEVWATRKHSGVVPDQFGNVSLWDLQDGEIATAFEKSPGGQTVTIADVCKARKWVAANIRAGEKFAEKVLEKDGFLHVKGNARRRK